MIFTGFKRKSTQFFFNKQLQKMLEDSKENQSKKVRTIVVFLNDSSDKDAILKSISKNLKLNENCVDFVMFYNKINKENACDNCFSPKDLGWYGKIKSDKLKAVLTKKYDLLINYSKVENIYCKLLVLQSKAAFKVGFSEVDKRMYDLMIDCEVSNVALFNSELKKYLEILNKL